MTQRSATARQSQSISSAASAAARRASIGRTRASATSARPLRVRRRHRFRREGALKNFERLTGVKGTLLDLFSREQYIAFHGHEPPAGWREVMPADISAGASGRASTIVLPVGAVQGLLRPALEEVEDRQISGAQRADVRGMWLALLEAFKDEPIPIILFENVPAHRHDAGPAALDQISSLLRPTATRRRRRTIAARSAAWRRAASAAC
jgi:hypothetical protein